MVQTVQQGPTRQQGTSWWHGRGSAGKGGFWALLAAGLLIVALVVGVAACGSNNQASSGSTVTSVAGAGQSTTGQSTTGQSFPSGPPSGTNGTPPSGFPGGSTPSTGGSGAAATTTTTTAAAADTTTTVAPTTTTSLSDGQHGDGIYKAGVDIKTGLYKGATVADGAHWEISKDANDAKYVASGDPAGQFYVKVTYGQYLRLNGVIIEKASSKAADPLATKDLTNGTYRVGYDIEAGWYTGKVTGDTTMGYWQISSDANGQTLVANDYPMGTFTVKVTKGQYITLRGVTISLQ